MNHFQMMTSMLQIPSRISVLSRGGMRSKRPDVERCLLCEKDVHIMRNHLSNKNKLARDDPVRRFVLSYYSSIETLRCYQCNTCCIRFGDKSRHDKSHDLEQIKDRENVDLFPPSIKVGVKNIIDGLSLPNIELVDQWASHQKGLVEDGSTSSRWEILSSQRASLCKAIEATKKFTHTEALASFVRSYYKKGNVARTTLIIYLGSFDKFVKYVKNHKPTLFPGLRKVDWLYLSSEVKQRY